MSSMPPPPPPPPDDQGRRPGAAPGGAGDGGGHTTPAAGSPPDVEPSAFQRGPTGAQRNSMAVAALVLGLVAFPGVFLIALVPIVQMLVIITPVVAIVAVVLGVLGIRRAKRPAVRGGVGMSVTGVVLGAINLLLTAGLVVLAVTFLRACPIDFDAPPEQATDQMLECMVEQGWLGPAERDLLEGQLQREFDQRR